MAEQITGDVRSASPLEIIDMRLYRIENTLRALEERLGNKSQASLLDQSALVETIARLDMQVRRLNSEIFATRITRHSNDGGETKRRQTLLGRVDELSSMAALGPVDQSFFLE